MTSAPDDTLEYLLSQDERQRQRREWYDKRTETMRERYGVDVVCRPVQLSRIRVIVSPWSVDELGNRTRTVRAG